jgi:hypothetical protein
MLEHNKMMRWTEGIDLERSTLRDQDENPMSLLGGLETKRLQRRRGRGFPQRREPYGGPSRALEATSHRRQRWEAENRQPPVSSEREEFEERATV